MNKNEFLDKIVFGYIKKDFERLLSLKPIPYGDGNINFFLALCVLVTIDFLGGFLLGGNRRFKENTKGYMNRCFNNPSEYPIGILKDIYRNGLAHDFFPRGAVTRDNRHPAVYLDKNRGMPVLDSETLARDFLVSLNEFKNKLEEAKFEKRWLKVEESISLEQKRKELEINNLPKEKGVSITDSCSSSSVANTNDNLIVYRTDPPQTFKNKFDETS